ncbi:MAG: DUF4236 domain-containing protein [Lachnospiraceae bacterium]|jgi:hypothetical protein|nr:DUF4236 domain-containing protein [Lachnospiraceae bacterium]MCI9202370.1 DUF4236 domain-containing protein [Lachnospiraceae bacterium]
MGIRFRKSIKLGGGFRINISSSGIGYSWGIPGYRITHTASGKTRTTTYIPGTGISHVTEKPCNSTKKTTQKDSFQTVNISDVKSGDISNLQPAEFKDLIDKIQFTLTASKVSTWMCLCLLLCASPVFLIIGILGVIIKVLLYFKWPVQLEYSFDESPTSQNAFKRINTWQILKESKQIWYVDRVGNTTSSRNSGGATGAYNRIPAGMNFSLPFYIRSNIQLPVIRLEKAKETLIILPDSILLIRKGKVGAVKYQDLSIDIYAIGEICHEAPAKDTKFSKNVWLYTNNDGSPDKRRKDNRQLPVYEIGRIDISSPNGLDVRLAISNTEVLQRFQSEYPN